MNRSIHSSALWPRTILLIACGLLLLLSACTRKYMVVRAPLIPDVKGYVKVKKDRQKDYTFKMKINVAGHRHRRSGKDAFIVWKEPRRNSIWFSGY